MKNPLIDEILESTPEDLKIFTSWYADLLLRIHEILEQKGLKQKDLAAMLGKKAPEISRWLAGDHNFTLRSLAKLQAELGEPLLYIPTTVVFQTTYHQKKTVVYKNEKKKDADGYNQNFQVVEEVYESEKVA